MIMYVPRMGKYNICKFVWNITNYTLGIIYAMLLVLCPSCSHRLSPDQDMVHSFHLNVHVLSSGHTLFFHRNFHFIVFNLPSSEIVIAYSKLIVQHGQNMPNLALACTVFIFGNLVPVPFFSSFVCIYRFPFGNGLSNPVHSILLFVH